MGGERVEKQRWQNVGSVFSHTNQVNVFCFVLGPHQAVFRATPDSVLRGYSWSVLGNQPYVVHGDGTQIGGVQGEHTSRSSPPPSNMLKVLRVEEFSSLHFCFL